uniref:Armadillo repeat-containing kinesin-like protein 2 n=1 Tax=Rhizophora mucronata TaxID=61149 RepID=A0A2P2PN07_RHIMU
MSLAFTSRCAKWQSASSMWRLIGAASLLEFCTIHGSAPSSIRKDLPPLIPCVDARDSHFAKFAIPRATWERTSGCPHLTIPNKAFIPPSDLSFICSLSGQQLHRILAKMNSNANTIVVLWSQYETSSRYNL